jgi:hypothetical protein
LNTLNSATPSLGKHLTPSRSPAWLSNAPDTRTSLEASTFTQAPPSVGLWAANAAISVLARARSSASTDIAYTSHDRADLDAHQHSIGYLNDT